MKRSNPGVSNRRQHKMQILLPAEPAINEDDPEPVYRVYHFDDLCKDNWVEWTACAVSERKRSLEMVSQYPTSPNIGALLDIETLVNKMEIVSVVSPHPTEHQSSSL